MKDIPLKLIGELLYLTGMQAESHRAYASGWIGTEGDRIIVAMRKTEEKRLELMKMLEGQE